MRTRIESVADRVLARLVPRLRAEAGHPPGCSFSFCGFYYCTPYGCYPICRCCFNSPPPVSCTSCQYICGV